MPKVIFFGQLWNFVLIMLTTSPLTISLFTFSDLILQIVRQLPPTQIRKYTNTKYKVLKRTNML